MELTPRRSKRKHVVVQQYVPASKIRSRACAPNRKGNLSFILTRIAMSFYVFMLTRFMLTHN